MSRPRYPGLTRELIAASALAVIDQDGLEAATMRRVAAALGVQAASLYNHVRSKEELLDLVADSVMQRVDVSAFETGGWRTALHDWAWSYYESLVAHPKLLPHLVVSFGRLDSALSRADQVYAGLLKHGWTPSRATRIAAAIRYAVYGAALGSFAGGFGPKAQTFPHLGEVERLQDNPTQVDRAALKLLIDRFLDGLDQQAPRQAL